MTLFALRRGSGAPLGSSLFAHGVLVPEVLPAAHGPPGLGAHHVAELGAGQHANAVRLAVIAMRPAKRASRPASRRMARRGTAARMAERGSATKRRPPGLR